MYVCLYVYLYVCMYVCKYVCTCVCMCLYNIMHTCIYIYMCASMLSIIHGLYLENEFYFIFTGSEQVSIVCFWCWQMFEMTLDYVAKQMSAKARAEIISDDPGEQALMNKNNLYVLQVAVSNDCKVTGSLAQAIVQTVENTTGELNVAGA